MSDLISRQAAIDALDEIEAEVADGYGYQYAKWREYFVEMPPAQEQIEMLADAYDGFPAQVMIKNCRDCTINIYPSQIRNVEAEGSEG